MFLVEWRTRVLYTDKSTEGEGRRGRLAPRGKRIFYFFIFSQLGLRLIRLYYVRLCLEGV